MIVSLARAPRGWQFVTPTGDYVLSDPFLSLDAALEHAALRMWTTVPLEA